MKLFTKKTISYLLIISMILTPFTTAHANEDISQNDMIVEQNNTPDVEVYDTGIKINGTFYTKDEFSILLKSSREIPIRQKRTALTIPAAADAYFIPGVGQVLITTTGIVILAGATIATGTWVSNRIISYFKEHTKNKRKSTHDKHTKPRPGRSNEKKKDPKKGCKPKNQKKPQQPRKRKKH